MLSFRSELAEERITPAAAQQVIVLVESEGGPEDRVIPHQAHEAVLDQLIEAVVLGATIWGRRRSRQNPLDGRVCHAVTSGPASTGRGDVSRSASCVAVIAVSMSAAVTP